MNTNPQRDWDELFEQLPLDLSPSEEHQNELKNQSLEAFDASAERLKTNSAVAPQKLALGLKKIGQLMMTYKAPYWTAAMIALGVVMWLGGTDNSAYAVDEVIKNIMTCDSAQYDVELVMKNGKTISQKHFFAAPGRLRIESDSTVRIMGKDGVLTLDTDSKTAIFVGVEMRKLKQLNFFQAMQKLLKDAETSPELVEVKEVGSKEIDGVEARGLVIRRYGPSALEFKVWADPESNFPVEVEMAIKDATAILSNYDFNSDVDESLFSTRIPRGYRVIATAQTDSLSEESFVAGLKAFVEQTGAFPASLNPQAPEFTKQILKFVEESKIPNDELTQTMLDLMTPIIQFPAVQSAKPESGFSYAGNDAEVGDESQPIFWYRPEGSDQFRVLFADWSIKELPEAPVATR